VRDIRGLIINALAADAALADRHESFTELVAHFQDIAFGWAYAVLKDFHMAEEASQEAFITVWRELASLRQPEAFPAWLQRIVLTACNRLTRGQYVIFAPLEDAASVPVNADDPESYTWRIEIPRGLCAALKMLPEHERLVTVLFYLAEYTQAEIGELLGLPVTTVIKRLYSARQRLKKMMVEMFKVDLSTGGDQNDVRQWMISLG
jgi:RNA polymerase sigma factor (sigma-70 family)